MPVSGDASRRVTFDQHAVAVGSNRLTTVQTYDILMLIVLAGTTLFGFWKGMAWQIASLASLVVSYYAALRFSERLAPHIPYFGDQAPLNRFIAMLAIYAVTSFVIWMLFRMVSKIIDRVKLEGFDRQLGAILGFAKGALLCIAITFFAVTLLTEEQGQAIMSSQSGRYIVALLRNAHAVVPPELQPHLQKIEQRLSPDGDHNGDPPSGAQELFELWQNSRSQAQPSANSRPEQPPAAWPTPQFPPWPTQGGNAPPGGQTQVPNATASPYSSSPLEPRPFPGSLEAAPVSVER
jgi:membrane protein required for colicin V production